MWPKNYKDYPPDEPLVKNQVESGKGIVGCEMHDLNGWGLSHHIHRRPQRGLISSLISAVFGRKKKL